MSPNIQELRRGQLEPADITLRARDGCYVGDMFNGEATCMVRFIKFYSIHAQVDDAKNACSLWLFCDHSLSDDFVHRFNGKGLHTTCAIGLHRERSVMAVGGSLLLPRYGGYTLRDLLSGDRLANLDRASCCHPLLHDASKLSGTWRIYGQMGGLFPPC